MIPIQNPVKRKELYEYLKNNQLTDLNEEDFGAEYSSNSEKFKNLYSYLKENQLTDLNEEDFDNEYFGDLKKKDPVDLDSEVVEKPLDSESTGDTEETPISSDTEDITTKVKKQISDRADEIWKNKETETYYDALTKAEMEIQSKQPFEPQGRFYDMERAVDLGYERDENGRLPSRDYKTGRILKGRHHPTFPETIMSENENGYAIFRGEDGNYYSELNEENKAKFNTVNEENSDVGFVKREVAAQTYKDDYPRLIENAPTLSNDDGTKSTVRLSAETDENGRHWVFPTIFPVKNVNGEYYKWDIFDDHFEALEHAKKNNEVIEFDNLDDAIKYSENGLINHVTQPRSTTVEGKEENWALKAGAGNFKPDLKLIFNNPKEAKQEYFRRNISLLKEMFPKGTTTTKGKAFTEAKKSQLTIDKDRADESYVKLIERMIQDDGGELEYIPTDILRALELDPSHIKTDAFQINGEDTSMMEMNRKLLNSEFVDKLKDGTYTVKFNKDSERVTEKNPLIPEVYVKHLEEIAKQQKESGTVLGDHIEGATAALLGMPSGFLKGITETVDEVMDDGDVENVLKNNIVPYAGAKIVVKTLDHLSEKLHGMMRIYENGISESFKKGNWKDGIKQSTLAMAEMTPLMMLMAVAPELTPLVLAGQGYGDTLAGLRQEKAMAKEVVDFGGVLSSLEENALKYTSLQMFGHAGLTATYSYFMYGGWARHFKQLGNVEKISQKSLAQIRKELKFQVGFKQLKDVAKEGGHQLGFFGKMAAFSATTNKLFGTTQTVTEETLWDDVVKAGFFTGGFYAKGVTTRKYNLWKQSRSLVREYLATTVQTVEEAAIFQEITDISNQIAGKKLTHEKEVILTEHLRNLIPIADVIHLNNKEIVSKIPFKEKIKFAKRHESMLKTELEIQKIGADTPAGKSMEKELDGKREKYATDLEEAVALRQEKDAEIVNLKDSGVDVREEARQIVEARHRKAGDKDAVLDAEEVTEVAIRLTQIKKNELVIKDQQKAKEGEIEKAKEDGKGKEKIDEITKKYDEKIKELEEINNKEKETFKIETEKETEALKKERSSEEELEGLRVDLLEKDAVEKMEKSSTEPINVEPKKVEAKDPRLTKIEELKKKEDALAKTHRGFTNEVKELFTDFKGKKADKRYAQEKKLRDEREKLERELFEEKATLEDYDKINALQKVASESWKKQEKEQAKANPNKDVIKELQKKRDNAWEKIHAIDQEVVNRKVEVKETAQAKKTEPKKKTVNKAEPKKAKGKAEPTVESLEKEKQEKIKEHWEKRLKQIPTEHHQEEANKDAEAREKKTVLREWLDILKNTSPKDLEGELEAKGKNKAILTKWQQLLKDKLGVDGAKVFNLWLSQNRKNIDKVSKSLEEKYTPVVDKIWAEYEAKKAALKTKKAEPKKAKAEKVEPKPKAKEQPKKAKKEETPKDKNQVMIDKLTDNLKIKNLAKETIKYIEAEIELLKENPKKFWKQREDKKTEEHTYLLTQRPPSIGTHPEGQIRDAEEVSLGKRKAYRVTYDRALTEKEIAQFELTKEVTKADIGRKFTRKFGKGEMTIEIASVKGNEITIFTKVSHLPKKDKTTITTQRGLKKHLDGLTEVKDQAKFQAVHKPAKPPKEIPKEVYTPIVKRIASAIRKFGGEVVMHNVETWKDALKDAIAGKVANYLAYGDFEKLGFEETKQFKDLVKSKHIIRDYDLSELAGRDIFIMNPDNMMVGELRANGYKLPVGIGKGGVHFISSTGDVWAFSKGGKANADRLAKEINDQIDKYGDAHVILTKGSLHKLFSSHAGARGAMRVLEVLADKSLIDNNEFVKSLEVVAYKWKMLKEGEPIGDFHKYLESRFFGKSDISFAKRGKFVIEFIEHLTANGTKSGKNIEAIRKALNTDELIKNDPKRKTGKISWSTAGIRDAIGLMFSDAATNNAHTSDAYAVIRIKNKVQVVEGQKHHETYPVHVRSVDAKGETIRPELLLIKNKRQINTLTNWRDIETGNDKPTHVGKLGSNDIGWAYGRVKPLKEMNKPKFMTNDKGEIYGFEQNGKIHLNPEKINGNTPIHEAGHIWIGWAAKNRPDLYQAGLTKVRASRYLKEVKGSKFYQEQAKQFKDKNDREAYYRGEALAKAIGDNGEKFVSESKKRSFRDWVRNLWNSVKKEMGIRDLSAKAIGELTLDQFAKKVAADVLSSKDKATEDFESGKLGLEKTGIHAINQMMKAMREEVWVGSTNAEVLKAGRDFIKKFITTKNGDKWWKTLTKEEKEDFMSKSEKNQDPFTLAQKMLKQEQQKAEYRAKTLKATAQGLRADYKDLGEFKAEMLKRMKDKLALEDVLSNAKVSQIIRKYNKLTKNIEAVLEQVYEIDGIIYDAKQKTINSKLLKLIKKDSDYIKKVAGSPKGKTVDLPSKDALEYIRQNNLNNKKLISVEEINDYINELQAKKSGEYTLEELHAAYISLRWAKARADIDNANEFLKTKNQDKIELVNGKSRKLTNQEKQEARTERVLKAAELKRIALERMNSVLEEVKALKEAGRSKLKDHLKKESSRLGYISEGSAGSSNNPRARVSSSTQRLTKQARSDTHQWFLNRLTNFNKVWVRNITSSFDFMARLIDWDAEAMGDGFVYKYFIKNETGTPAAHSKVLKDNKKSRTAWGDKVDEIFDLKKSFFDTKKDYKLWGMKNFFQRSKKVVSADKTGVTILDADTGKRIGRMMSKSTATSVYLWSKMEGTNTNLLAAGYDSQSIKEVKQFLGKKYLELADWMGESLREKWTEYNDVYVALNRTRLGFIENYFPLKYITEDLRTEVKVEDSKFNSMAAINPRHSIDRKDNKNALDDSANAFTIFDNYISEMNHFKHYARVAKDLNAVLNNKQFKHNVRSMTADNWLYTQFKQASAEVLGVKLNHPHKSVEAFEKLAYGVTKAISLTYVGFKVWTGAKQILSYFAALEQADNFYIGLGGSEDKNRRLHIWGVGGAIMQAKLAARVPLIWRDWKFFYKNSNKFKDRIDKGTLGNEHIEALSRDNSVLTTTGILRQYAIRYGLAPNRLVDGMTIAWTGKAIYDQQFKNYRKYFGKAEAHRRAIRDFEIYFETTQQSASLENLSEIQRNKALSGAIGTPFKNAQFSYFRKISGGMQQYSRNYIKAKLKYQKQGKKNPGKLAAWELLSKTKNQDELKRIILYGWVMPMAWQWVASGLPGVVTAWDDEDKYQMGRAARWGVLDGAWMIGDAAKFMTDITVGGKRWQYSPSILINEINEFGADISKAMQDGGIISPKLAWLALKYTLKFKGFLDLDTGVRVYEGLEKLIKDGYKGKLEAAAFYDLFNLPEAAIKDKLLLQQWEKKFKKDLENDDGYEFNFDADGFEFEEMNLIDFDYEKD